MANIKHCETEKYFGNAPILYFLSHDYNMAATKISVGKNWLCCHAGDLCLMEWLVIAV